MEALDPAPRMAYRGSSQLRALRRWLARATPPILPTRLREEDAIALAREAAAEECERALLTMATLVRHEGGAIWIVGTATVGSQVEIHIDDTTGRVLERRRVGLR